MRRFIIGFNPDIRLKLIAFCVLATALTASWSALASEGCGAFNGRADDQTKGEGGNRVGAGFSKGDIITATIYQDPGQKRMTVNLLEYASPNGPFRALVKDTSDSFTYTVPANTGDFIYLNFGGPLPGMIVTWSCTPAP
jgi:hypothetical protein